MKKYKNVVFDIGDVLLSYRWFDMLTKDYKEPISKEEAMEIGRWIFEDPLWKQMDEGIRPLSDIVDDYCKENPDKADILRWFLTNPALMSVPREAIWEKVHELKKRGFRIYLLSNYNPELLYQHSKGAWFYADIDGKIVSGDYHVLKPDKAIYDTLFRVYGLDPSECIFFDDRVDNIMGGKKEGMDGVQVPDEESLSAEIDKLLAAGPQE